MNTEQLYYDTIGPLIPCKFIGWVKDEFCFYADKFEVLIEIGDTGHGWTKGEKVQVLPRDVVVKAGMKGYHQMVRSAVLPKRTEQNCILLNR